MIFTDELKKEIENEKILEDKDEGKETNKIENNDSEKMVIEDQNKNNENIMGDNAEKKKMKNLKRWKYNKNKTLWKIWK